MAGGTVYGPIGYIHIDPKIHLPQIVIFSDQLIDELGITADAVLRCIPLNGEPVLKTIGGFHERFNSIGLHQPSTGLRLAEQKSPLLAELAGVADIDFPENPTDADYEEFKHIYSVKFPTACEELMLVTHTRVIEELLDELREWKNGLGDEGNDQTESEDDENK